MDRWRNGSAFDSRSKGYPFKSGVVQFLESCHMLHFFFGCILTTLLVIVLGMTVKIIAGFFGMSIMGFPASTCYFSALN